MVDYIKALQKPFSDITKLAIGIIISIIPIVNLAAIGFALESSGLGKAKKSDKMPEWKNWTDLFVKGLMSLIIAIVYMLPALIVFGVAAGFFFTSLLAGIGGGMSTGMMKEVSGVDMGRGNVILYIMQNNWGAVFQALLTAAPILLLGAVLAIIAAYMTPMAVLNYIKNKKVASAFVLNEVIRKSFNANYFAAFIVVLIVSFVAALLLTWIPLFGLAALGFIISVFKFTVFGEVYRNVK